MVPVSSGGSVPSSSLPAGGVPSSFVVAGVAVPSSGFVSALPAGVAGPVLVVPGSLGSFSSRFGAVGVGWSWRCPSSGVSGSLRCLGSGFPSPAAAAAFLGFLRSALADGVPVFFGGAPGASGSVLSGWACAGSPSPFPAAPASGLAGFGLDAGH